MRLDKFICKSTNYNRAQAQALIHAGQILVNSETITNEAVQVHENNLILLNAEKLIARPSRYIMMHKPPATICSNIDEGYPSLFNWIDIENVSELHIAGRLDADTTGLVLITDDGRWSFDIIRPDKMCEKVYRVTLRDQIATSTAEHFAHGVQLQGEKGLTAPAKLEIVAPKEVLLRLTEGKYHQVKRMFAAVGNRVVALHREEIGSIALDVEQGQWRYLSRQEVESISC